MGLRTMSGDWLGWSRFMFSTKTCPFFQHLLDGHPWCSHGPPGMGCYPSTTRSQDPSHHGKSDLGIKPQTALWTTSPRNSQDLQRASAPGGASGKQLSSGDPPHEPRVCWESPRSELSQEPLPSPRLRCRRAAAPRRASFSSGGSKQTLLWGSALQWCSK